MNRTGGFRPQPVPSPPIDKLVADVRQYFLEWLARDGFPFWPYWENIRTW